MIFDKDDLSMFVPLFLLTPSSSSDSCSLFTSILLLQSWQWSVIETTCSTLRGQKIPLFSAGLPHNMVAAQVAHQASLIQLKDTEDAHKKDFATVFGVMGENMETTHFFCSKFKENEAVQRKALLLNLERETIKDGPTLPVVIVVGRQGL